MTAIPQTGKGKLRRGPAAVWQKAGPRVLPINALNFQSLAGTECPSALIEVRNPKSAGKDQRMVAPLFSENLSARRKGLNCLYLL